jgi:hypothetical protein
MMCSIAPVLFRLMLLVMCVLLSQFAMQFSSFACRVSAEGLGVTNIKPGEVVPI